MAHAPDVARASAAVEDYVKAIYGLERAGSESPAPASTTAIAERMGVTPGSASGMVKRLDELGLVTHVPYRGVRLTESGRRLALEVIRHHRLLELYLVEGLGLSWDEVHEEAEVLEHVLSEHLEQVISARLGHPTRDPHGDPIPGPDLELAEPATVALEALAPGRTGTFVRVSDADPAMLRHLAERGIAPGDPFEVVEREPFGGPLRVRFGDAVHPLGGELTRAMRVDPDGGGR